MDDGKHPGSRTPADSTDHQAPESPRRPASPAPPFDRNAHLMRLFDTDPALVPGIGTATVPPCHRAGVVDGRW